MSDEEAVLAANEAFYRAFAARDFAAMDALWAAEAPVACIHPGWDALVGPRGGDGELGRDPRRPRRAADPLRGAPRVRARGPAPSSSAARCWRGAG